MITPMMKYSFLIYHKEYIPFLEKLQDLGMLHIIEKKKDFDENIRISIQQVNEINKALKFLAKRNQEEAPEKPNMEGLQLVEEIKKLTEEISFIEQEQLSLNKEIQKVEPWGNFSPAMHEKFKPLHIKIKFFICPEKKVDPEWSSKYFMEVVNIQDGKAHIVVFQYGADPVDIDAEEIKLPEQTLSELKQKFEDNTKRLEEIQVIFDEYAIRYQEELRNVKADLQQKIDFELAINHTEKQAEDKLMLLEGWIPEEKREGLETMLEAENVYYISSLPTAEDNVPIKLTNNKFSKLFEPIGDLFSLPDYKELDLTPFFAPFFMLFFGFCVGDTGYGLLILIATLVLRSKVSEKLKPMLTLASFLGAATVIMGFISGTFFGVDLLKVESYPLKEFILEPLKLFWLSIGIGGVQIFYGMIIKAANQIKQRGFKYGLSTIGWIMMILSGGLILGAGEMGFELSKYLSNGLLIISGALILVFSNPDINVFASIGSGLYDVYNMVTGVFGDLLSYIRLFALGISSAILGLVFNQIAAQFLGGSFWGYIPFIIVLLIGHGLNIFLAALGAFVHPLRLTFVEFYKNAGFTGGGKPYKPFSK
ncbi:MAG TPA: V-type ATPase 116kDa subunit family protein [Bacteroidales bacterium]|nr:V-type ATPase 116kDa subunit family protein [Bacteroidales bacterium]